MAAEIKPEYRAAFIEEAEEHLNGWEEALLHLEQSPNDTEIINEMFRAIHTLKGSAGFIGFEKLQRLNHDLENALQQVRDGEIALNPDIVEGLFDGLDLSRKMVESFRNGEEFEGDVDRLLEHLSEVVQHATSADPSSPGPAEPSVAVAKEDNDAAGEEQLRFRLALAVTASGRETFLRCVLVRARLSQAATILSETPKPEDMKSSDDGFRYEIELTTGASPEQIRGLVTLDQVVIEELLPLAETPAAPAAQPAPESTQETKGDTAHQHNDEVVRVSVERLDNLLNLVGELVVQNSSFENVAHRLRDRLGRDAIVLELQEKTEALSKVARDLQDGIMKVRMLPVKNVFSRFHRVVRDIGKGNGKEVALDIYGEETEIDKKVMDKISDPLVHLVRNAVDHGLETTEERGEAGKATTGLVRLGAYQEGDHICIEVSDDGKGIDREAVLKKAIERGLVTASNGESLSDEQVFAFIFHPGFSTAATITEISGRGVGMDVVKRAIDNLGGSVRVRSFHGRGTTVTISLPLTMAIISALLVSVEHQTLAVPLSAVREVLRPEADSVSTVGKQPVVRLRDAVVPLVRLSEALSLSSGRTGAKEVVGSTAIIVENANESVGLIVDGVIGTREIVIKSLRRHYREIEGLIGASVLGNGAIALIVDVEAMVRRYRTTSAAIPRSAAIALPADPHTRITPNEIQDIDRTPPREELELSTGQERVSPLAEGERALFAELNNEGALKASQSLSQIIGRQISVSFPESSFVQIAVVPETLGGEELTVGGIYVGITGDVTGGMLMVLPREQLIRLYNLLLRRPPETATDLAEVDFSAVAELGNILSASFANALSDATKLSVVSAPPEISIDMCASVIDTVIARFNEPGDRILLTKTLVYLDGSEEVVCDLLMFLDPDSMRLVLESIEDSSAQESGTDG